MYVWGFIIFLSIGAFADFEGVSLEECGVSKGCLRPPACPDIHCEYGATWRLVEINGDQYIEFELLGDVKSSDGFISLSFSRDPYYGGDGFVGCYFDVVSHEVTASAGYRPEVSMENKLYRQLESEKFLVFKGDNLGGSYSDSLKYLQCRFRRLVTPANKANLLKDLAPPNKYYLIIQRGSDPRSNNFGNVFAGGEVVSNEDVIVTSHLYDTSIGVLPRGSGIIKAHGCMMVLAWIFCSSVGVILSRYYKDMWPNSWLMGERVWFQFHRILMGFCVGLTILSVILAFIFCSGYSSLTTYPDYIHPILGLIVLILAVINPFITFCRCHPLHKSRPYFNWIHFFVGTIAYVLAIPTMMLGLRMPGAGAQLRTLNYPLWILIFFVIFQFCVEIILEIHGCLHYRRDKNRKRAYRDEVEQYQMASKTGGAPVPRPVEPEPSGRLFKYFMIGLHATVCAIVAVVLIIIIAVN